MEFIPVKTWLPSQHSPQTQMKMPQNPEVNASNDLKYEGETFVT
jgi:hypothetical protein